jgi:Flp pilus assembly protein TadD
VSAAPNAADAHNLLGVALASQGGWRKARAQFGEALRLDPSRAQARANWERARVNRQTFAEPGTRNAVVV